MFCFSTEDKLTSVNGIWRPDSRLLSLQLDVVIEAIVSYSKTSLQCQQTGNCITDFFLWLKDAVNQKRSDPELDLNWSLSRQTSFKINDIEQWVRTVTCWVTRYYLFTGQWVSLSVQLSLLSADYTGFEFACDITLYDYGHIVTFSFQNGGRPKMPLRTYFSVKSWHLGRITDFP